MCREETKLDTMLYNQRLETLHFFIGYFVLNKSLNSFIKEYQAKKILNYCLELNTYLQVSLTQTNNSSDNCYYKDQLKQSR